MKINHIAISNILSFKDKRNFTKNDKIFFTPEINVLIGPNGSGKSNFLEIIYRFFSAGLIMDCQINEQNFNTYQRTDDGNLLKNLLVFPQQFQHQLPKNHKSKTKVKWIEIELSLNKFDKQNLNFLRKNVKEINTLFQKYSNVSADFPDSIRKKDIDNLETVLLKFDDQSHGENMFYWNEVGGETIKFVFMYFRWFKILQNIIELENQLNQKPWKKLKNTYAVLGSHRSFSNFNPMYDTSNRQRSMEQLRERTRNEGIKSVPTAEPTSILNVKEKLVFAHINKEIENSNVGTTSVGRTIEQIDSPIFNEINSNLKKYLNLVMDVSRFDESHFQFLFKDKKSKNNVLISELSGGEKEIFHLIFTIFGNELKNGVIIIDEPEIHLHPKLQVKILDLIKSIGNKLDIQFIIATHSPVFVDEHTIQGTHRFFKKNNFTRVIWPQNISTPDKDLITFLKYTNSAKIFFGDKVVLVEGQSDEYFYKYFYSKFSNKDIEFLDIVGKGNNFKWREFLKKYQIPVYYIGDVDNIFNNWFNVLDATMKQSWKASFNAQPAISNLISTDRDYEDSHEYRTALIKFIQQNNQSDWAIVKNRIRNLYSDNIFILQKGELENYLNIPTGRRKVERIINFCSSSAFDNFFTSNSQNAREIRDIFTRITK